MKGPWRPASFTTTYPRIAQDHPSWALIAARRAIIWVSVASSLLLVSIVGAPGSFAIDSIARVASSTVTSISATSLPISTFGGVVVDGAHSRVYVSGGSSVLSLDFEGNLLQTIPVASAGQMALDGSTSTLYVAGLHTSPITKISTETNEVVGQIHVSNPLGFFLAKTGQLALVNDRLWMGSGFTACNDSSNTANGGLASIPVSGDSPYTTYSGVDFPSMCIEMASSPWRANTLFVWEPGRSTPRLFVYDVSSGSPSTIVSDTVDSQGNLQDVDVLPDGSTVATAAWSPPDASELVVSTLEQTGVVYPLTERPNALAVTDADGGYVAATTDSSDGPNLFVFPIGSDAPKTAVTVAGGIPERRGLAFAPDGSKLFVVTRDGSSFSLTVLDDAVSLHSSTLAVSISPSPGLATDTLSIAVDLSMLGTDARASQSIEIVRHDPDDTETVLQGGSTDGAGHFVASDSPGAGTFIYTASWVGDAEHRGATDSATVVLEKFSTTLTLNSSGKKVDYGKTVTLTADLSGFSGSISPVVSIYAKPYGGLKTLAASGPINAAGEFSLAYKMAKRTTFTAEWAGDAEHAGDVASPVVVEVRPKVKGTLTGFYATSGAYRLYHYTSRCPASGAGCPRYTIEVRPNHRGHYVYLRMQTYKNGAWRAAPSSRFRLNSESKRVIIFVYRDRGIIGLRVRIRATIDGHADHLPGSSPWSYFRVTS